MLEWITPERIVIAALAIGYLRNADKISILQRRAKSTSDYMDSLIFWLREDQDFDLQVYKAKQKQ